MDPAKGTQQYAFSWMIRFSLCEIIKKEMFVSRHKDKLYNSCKRRLGFRKVISLSKWVLKATLE